jgi:Ca2+-binding RTX toxin-like protein
MRPIESARSIHHRRRLQRAAFESLETRRLLSQISFQAVSSPLSGTYPSDPIVADLDGDGTNNLIVSYNNDNTNGQDTGNSIGILTPGSVPGSWEPGQTLQVGNGPVSIVASDLTGSGRLDLVTANSTDNTVSVLINGGSGFYSAVNYPVGTQPEFVTAADLTGDGKPDLIVGGQNGVNILINNGDGTFQAPENFSTPNYVRDIVAADVNGDGLPDLIVANSGYTNNPGDTITVFINQGAGHFKTENYSVGNEPQKVAVGDLGNGHLDIVAANKLDGTLSVLLGNGDGTFQPPQTITIGANRTDYVAIADVNGDGHPDLLIGGGPDNDTGSSDAPPTLGVLFGNGDGTFQAPRFFTPSSSNNISGGVVADVTGNGKPDVVLTSGYGQAVVTLLDTTGGQLTFSNSDTSSTGNKPGGVASADFNGDGHADLAVINKTDNTVGVLLGNGDGTFQPQHAYSVGNTPQIILTGSLGGGTGPVDIVTFNQPIANVDGSFSVLLNNGNGTFQPAETFNFASPLTAATLADVNGDGKPDLIVAYAYSSSTQTETVAVMLGNGNGTFQAPQTFVTGQATIDAFAVGDLNGDGHPDIVTANTTDDTVSVFLGNGDGTFQSYHTYAAGSDPTAVAIGDLTGDGHPDIVTLSNYTGDANVLINNGDGTFQPYLSYFIGTHSGGMLLDDFNGDGVPDVIAISNYGGIVTADVLLGTGNAPIGPSVIRPAISNYSGLFEPVQVVSLFAGKPGGGIVADVNGDGRPDLILTEKSANSVAVFLDHASGTPHISMTSNGTVMAMGSNSSGTSSITYSNGMVTFNIEGVTESFSVNSVTGINVALGNGDDNVAVGSGVPAVSIFGGTGNDTLVADNSAPDTLHGGSGNNYEVGGNGSDMLKGGTGRDTLGAGAGNQTTIHAGAGDDLILDGTGSGDSIFGGLGLNFAQYNPNNTMNNIFEVFDPPPPGGSPSFTPANLTPFDSSVTAAIENGILIVTGAPGSNKMIVTVSGANLEVTSNGNTVASFPESEVSGIKIIAGPDNDTLHINASVTLPATLKGGAGEDKLVGGSGDNVLVGGTGNSILKAGAGVSLLVPEKRVVFSSSGANDTLIGGSGLSIADFSHRTDPLFLSNDNQPDSGDPNQGEAIEIMSSVTAIWGGVGNDTIVGTTPGEFLSGGAGDNTVHGGGATDVLIGGDGQDTVVAAAEPVSLYLDLTQPGEYGGITDPAEDVLQINPDLDTLLPG